MMKKHFKKAIVVALLLIWAWSLSIDTGYEDAGTNNFEWEDISGFWLRDISAAQNMN